MPRTRVRVRLKPRALAVGLAVPVVAAGAYALARQTSMFAIRSVAVAGGTTAVQAQVRAALRPVLGKSLLAFGGGAVVARLEALPTVVSASYDRAFPHTLRVTVVPERPIAVVRSGRSSWLVSARGRAIARVPRHAQPGLPRIWVPTSEPIAAGGFLPADGARVATSVLSLASGFPARFALASFAHGAVTLRLRSGIELRLGDPVDVRLKLAVARRALRAMPPGATYVDVAVPQRPVAGADPRLSGTG